MISIEDQLRHFAEDVGLACALENGGKITPQEAVRRIKRRFKTLKAVVKELDNGQNPISPDS